MLKCKNLLAGLIIVCGGLLTACGSDDSAAADQVTLELFSQKMEMRGLLEEIVANFEEENPDISINLTSLNDANVVLRTRMAGNDAPDIIHVYPQNSDFKEWAEDSRFLNLEGERFLDNLKEGAAEIYAVNDRIYSLPLTTNVYGVYFNQTAFNELGLKVPHTWDEFVQLVEQISEIEYAPFAAALSTSEGWTLNGFHQLAWAIVTGGFDEAQEALIGSGINGISETDPVFLKVAEMLSLITDHTQRNAIGASYADSVVAFTSGEALMLPQGSWALPAINEQNPEFEVAMFPFPGLNVGEELTIGAADLAFSISADISDERQEAAKRFLAYLTEPEVMQKYFDIDGSPTSVLNVDTEGRFTEISAVTELAFTDRQLIWLNAEWLSEADFHTLTIEYIVNQNKENFVSDLNQFFNQMK